VLLLVMAIKCLVPLVRGVCMDAYIAGMVKGENTPDLDFHSMPDARRWSKHCWTAGMVKMVEL